MSREMAADGQNVELMEQLIDTLYQSYQAFLTAHAGEVSPSTAAHGVIAAATKMLVTIHGSANPEEEELVSWDAFKHTCVQEFERVLSEPRDDNRVQR